MKKMLLSLVMLFASATYLFSQSGWTTLSNAYIGNYNDVCFTNSDTGYSVGSDGYVIITPDAGVSGVGVSVSTSALNTVFFINDSVGFVAGNNGKIFKTINYGLSWQALTIGTTANLNKIYFVNDTLGYVAGDNGVFFNTTNAGASWSSPIISGYSYDINSYAFINPNLGYAVGATATQGYISKTTSGGAYWTNIYLTFNTMNDIAFATSDTGYAVGDNGNIYKTFNGGLNWSILSSPTVLNLNAIHFATSKIGYIVGDTGLVLKTTNGGISWVIQSTPTTQNLYALDVVSPLKAFAVGGLGSAIKTITGGNFLSISVPDYSATCHGFVNLTTTTNYNGTDVLSYSWSSSNVLNNASIASPTAGPMSSNLMFYVTVTDGSLQAIDSTFVSLIALNSDSICLVGVNDTSNNNILVFEKHISGPIAFYKVYRESNVANIYDSIGTIPFDSAGVFVDFNSNPAVKSYSYKISTVDSCGLESTLSNNHKTMHLSVNQGVGTSWNLLWNAYYGVPIATYRIWRGDSLHNLHLIDSVPGTSISYTDTTSFTGSLYYQVEIISTYNCQPYNFKSGLSFGSSKSNKAFNGVVITPVPPVANFTANITSGNFPLTVNFQDLSQGNANAWDWDFGDGSHSTLKNPTHIYTAKGTYTVSLIVTNNFNLKDTLEKVAYINAHNNGIGDGETKVMAEIFPNPCKSNQTLHINIQNGLIQSVEILDLLGKNIATYENIGSANYELNGLSDRKGIYLVRVRTTENQTLLKKITLY